MSPSGLSTNSELVVRPRGRALAGADNKPGAARLAVRVTVANLDPWNQNMSP